MRRHSRKLWTLEEEQVILNAVKDCPNNLKLAFEAASHELEDRTVKAITNRWYTCISKRTDKESIALMCVSGKTYGINRKNCKTPIENIGGPTGFMRLWNRLINFFGA